MGEAEESGIAGEEVSRKVSALAKERFGSDFFGEKMNTTKQDYTASHLAVCRGKHRNSSASNALGRSLERGSNGRVPSAAHFVRFGESRGCYI